jgi:hypothetical protein
MVCLPSGSAGFKARAQPHNYACDYLLALLRSNAFEREDPYVEKVRKQVSYADAVRGTNTHPESSTVYDAVHWHVVKSRKSKKRNVRLSVSHSLE